MADRWQDSLAVAEEGCRVDPASPWPIFSLAAALLNLGEIREAVSRITLAANTSQYYRVLQSACWYHCALAETIERDERDSVLLAAKALMERSAKMVPLADRECRTEIARTCLDLASMQDDHTEMARWSGEVRSPFYRRVLANLHANPTGRRVRLPYKRTIQKHVECVPTSISTALSSMAVEVPLEEFAREVTFGGTYEWAAADWLRQRGLHVRFFAVDAELASRLIEVGIAFTLSWDDDESGHCVAIVGIDHAAGTVIAHDPSSFRSTEYLLSSLNDRYSPTGILGMAAVPEIHKAKLDAILPRHSALAEASEGQKRAFARGETLVAAAIVNDCESQFPHHQATKYLRSNQNLEEGKVGKALHGFAELLAEFSVSAAVRVRWMSSCRAVGDSALLRKTLQSVVERGRVPGVDSQNEWTRPHPRYVHEYADLLRGSTKTRSEAETLLRVSLRHNWRSAGGWHILADLRWDQGAKESARLGYRIASTLAEHNDHYARAYADVLRREAQPEEALQWLESRANRLGTSDYATSTWITYISALEDWGQPTKALETCRDALQHFSESSSLLTFAIPFLGRMGQWQEAERWFEVLRAREVGSSVLEAAAHFFEMRGLTKTALKEAEAWVIAAPLSLTARRRALSLTSRVHGYVAAINQAAVWMHERPENDHFEELFCEQTEVPVWRKIRVLRLRLKRNPDDAWAWRELAFTSINHFQMSAAKRQDRLRPLIRKYLDEANRLSAGDAITLRAVGLWHEAQQETQAAVDCFLESIRLDPGHSWAYRKLFNVSSRFAANEREALWAKIETIWMTNVGELPNCLAMMQQLNDLFGPQKTEQILAGWRKKRPNDPGLIEATADLLLDFGNGSSNAKRAMQLLNETVEQYPYNSGLRHSLARACRIAGDDAEAGKVFEQLVSHRPEYLSARIEFAQIREREGRTEESLQILREAAEIEPQDFAPLDAQARILIDHARYDEAVAVVEEALLTLTRGVRLFERSIAVLSQCGQEEKAIAAARQGVLAYPDGAYLWLLLAKALREHEQFAAPAEIELCLKKSLQLNQSLYETADLLAISFCEQRRYEDAYQVLADVEKHIVDPSPALGRRAWIKRQAGETQQALKELADLMQGFPNYAWGWNLLLEWMQEDKAWELCKKLLHPLPASMQSDAVFRRRRLSALKKAGEDQATLDTAWLQLLDDFPNDTPLHLLRYDSLRDAGRWDEARNTLERVMHESGQNVYLMARLADLSVHDKRFDNAMGYAQNVCFATVEQSPWPVNRIWEVFREARQEAGLARKFRLRVDDGEQPTHRALARYEEHLIGDPLTGSLALKWISQTPLNQTARQIRTLMKMITKSPWSDGGYISDFFTILNTKGYTRLVVSFWRKLQNQNVKLDTTAWAEAGRAMIDRKQHRWARSLFRDWRGRRGVQMWCIANYMLSIPRIRKQDFQEVIDTCRDALNSLMHDHCAAYLAHLQAEAYALIDDQQGLRDVWQDRRAYFSTVLKKGEYFRKQDERLRHQIPDLVEALERDDQKAYRKLVWKMRLQRLRPVNGRRTLLVLLRILAFLWVLAMISIAFRS
jgi:tetratricopeptide (TPR) repeat protein